MAATTLQSTTTLPTLTLPTTNLSQTYQQMLQSANNTVASQALPLVQILNTVVAQLPAISHGLNVVDIDLSRFVGPRAAGHDTQVLQSSLDWILINLENVTGVAVQAAGMSQNPTYTMDTALL
ncbi:MAG: hypothetical protein ACRELG_30800, partial [Gemmataceae bacterium]